jgi:hypothetical protein
LLLAGRRECADARLDCRPFRLQRGDQPLDLRELVFEPGEATLAGAGPVIVETRRHRADLAGREAGGDHVADASGAPQVGRVVPAIAVGVAPRREQALHLVMPQGTFADAEAIRCFLDPHSASLSTTALAP